MAGYVNFTIVRQRQMPVSWKLVVYTVVRASWNDDVVVAAVCVSILNLVVSQHKIIRCSVSRDGERIFVIGDLRIADATISVLHPDTDGVVLYMQGSAKEWILGCVKHAPAARGGQDAKITQPRDHSLADPVDWCYFKHGLKILLKVDQNGSSKSVLLRLNGTLPW